MPEADPENPLIKDAIEQLRRDIKDLIQQYIAAMEAIRIREGISKAMAISSRTNKFLQVHLAFSRATTILLGKALFGCCLLLVWEPQMSNFFLRSIVLYLRRVADGDCRTHKLGS